jgi:hypothetical protein
MNASLEAFADQVTRNVLRKRPKMWAWAGGIVWFLDIVSVVFWHEPWVGCVLAWSYGWSDVDETSADE